MSTFRARGLLLCGILVIGVGTMALIGRGVGSSQPKPVLKEPINTFFNAPPDNIADMVTHADAVVLGRMVGRTPLNPRDSAGPPRFASHFQVLEILHNFTKQQVDPQAIDILRPSGDIDLGSHVVSGYQVGFPEFDRGHQYVVFLSWNEALPGWVPAYGPDSVFDVTTGHPQTFGRSALADKLTRKSSDDLLNQVRFLGR